MPFKNIYFNMSFRKDFKDILLKVIAGLIVAIIVALGSYLYNNPNTQFSWVVTSPLNLLNKIYFSFSVPMRLNMFFWIMTFFLYYLLEKYDEKYEIGKKRTIKELNFKSGSFSLYSFFVTIGLINIDTFGFPHNELTLIISDSVGVLLTILGFIIVGLGRVEIDGLWGPHLYDYSDPNLKKLVKTGIYAKMRHPIYFGQAMLAFSTFICSNSFLLLFFPLVVMIINSFRAFYEEKHLSNEFNEEYKEYQHNVKKWWWY